MKASHNLSLSLSLLYLSLWNSCTKVIPKEEEEEEEELTFMTEEDQQRQQQLDLSSVALNACLLRTERERDREERLSLYRRMREMACKLLRT